MRTMSQLSVVLIDLGVSQNVAQVFKSKLTNLLDHVNNFERTTSKLGPLSRLNDRETRLDKRPGAAVKFPDVMASDTSSLMGRSGHRTISRLSRSACRAGKGMFQGALYSWDWKQRLCSKRPKDSGHVSVH